MSAWDETGRWWSHRLLDWAAYLNADDKTLPQQELLEASGVRVPKGRQMTKTDGLDDPDGRLYFFWVQSQQPVRCCCFTRWLSARAMRVQGDCLPSFLFLFFSPSPLAVTLCEVWRRNICLARPPFQTVPGRSVRSGEKWISASGDVGAQQLLGLPSWPSIVSSSLCPSRFMGLSPFCVRQPRPKFTSSDAGLSQGVNLEADDFCLESSSQVPAAFYLFFLHSRVTLLSCVAGRRIKTFGVKSQVSCLCWLSLLCDVGNIFLPTAELINRLT